MYRSHFLSHDNAKVTAYKKYSNTLSVVLFLWIKKIISNPNLNWCKSNLRSTWKQTGNLIQRKTKGQSHPARVVFGNKTFTNPVDIAEQLNTYFLNVGPSLTSKLDTDPYISPTQNISCCPSSSFLSQLTSFIPSDRNRSLYSVCRLRWKQVLHKYTTVSNKSFTKKTATVDNLWLCAHTLCMRHRAPQGTAHTRLILVSLWKTQKHGPKRLLFHFTYAPTRTVSLSVFSLVGSRGEPNCHHWKSTDWIRLNPSLSSRHQTEMSPRTDNKSFIVFQNPNHTNRQSLILWLRKLQQFHDITRTVEVHCDAFLFFCDWVGMGPFPSLCKVGSCLRGVGEAKGWPSFVVALNDENRVVDVILSRGEKMLLVRASLPESQKDLEKLGRPQSQQIRKHYLLARAS